MHGKTIPDHERHELAESRLAGLRTWVANHRKWLMIVLLPTVLTALYLYLITADQYVSEAHFTVRSTQSSPATEGGLGQALSLVGASTQQSEASSVSDYLSSHDAVAALEKNAQLVERFRRPEADFFSRLSSEPTAETLAKFYHKQVDVKLDSSTGIAVLKVRAFRPEDAYLITNKLLELGERRVNELNQRLYASTLGLARRQLAEAEAGVTRTQGTLTSYRQGRRDINPQASGQAQIGLVSELQGQLSAARAQAAAMSAAVAGNSPQLVAVRARVRALEAQVGAQAGRLTAGGTSIAAGLGGYEELELRQQFAGKRYDAAAAALEKAREQAQRQQLFIVRVVEPNLAEKSLYPERLKIILTVFFGLMLAYGIGWLIAAGVREHAA
jgi:capsular polysaccharide transport system permease protein